MKNKNTAQKLNKLLADSYTLYLKTHNFHWNVTGESFSELHALFMAQYNELFLAVDTIAERIRALGFAAPGSFAEFLKLTTVKEAPATHIKASEMISALLESNKEVVASAKDVLKAATEANDDVTIGIAVNRIEIHEKTIWMLNATLNEPITQA